MINNKDKYLDKPEVLKLLERFEKAMNDQDKLSLIVISHELKRLGLEIEVAKKGKK